MFKVGDIICYKHDGTKVGVVVQVSSYAIDEEDRLLKYPIRFEDEQCYLVIWQTPNESGMKKWYVNESWIEKLNE